MLYFEVKENMTVRLLCTDLNRNQFDLLVSILNNRKIKYSFVLFEDIYFLDAKMHVKDFMYIKKYWAEEVNKLR